ncbi:glutaredoxin 3 [Novacetimonas cocois]|uniref:Glutaredoxin n=1 Tax=Novacetimonas cocois TaxID=1747507 RepID=A0A365YRJ2_9PROT|nr:glutaredoxin 3 [Novacetimonas cocois]RBM05416.1 glutaredoxin 3 [Novacetimonas cocois]
MPEIEIYTQPGCPYCVRAVRLLQSKGVPFEEITALHGTQARKTAVERSGGHTTMPQVFVDGKFIGGCDDIMALDRAGKLDLLLGAG